MVGRIIGMISVQTILILALGYYLGNKFPGKVPFIS